MCKLINLHTLKMCGLDHFYHNKAERKRKIEGEGGERQRMKERKEGREGGRGERMRGLHLSRAPSMWPATSFLGILLRHHPNKAVQIGDGF